MNEATCPKVLYKYRDWEKVYHRRILTDYELFFPPPSFLNDPFECAVPIRFDHGDEEAWYQHIFRRLRRTSNQNDKWLSETARDVWGFRHWRDPAAIEQSRRDQVEIMENNFGICSLSEHRDDLLTWAHYANGHRGFCVGLDTRQIKNKEQEVFEDLGLFLDFHKVTYHEEYPFIDGFDPDDSVKIARKLSTKGMQWAYECEWRLVLYSGSAHRPGPLPLELRTLHFLPQMVTEIVLGALMPEPHRDEILRLKEQHMPHAEVYNASKSDAAFQLNFEKL